MPRDLGVELGQTGTESHTGERVRLYRGRIKELLRIRLMTAYDWGF